MQLRSSLIIIALMFSSLASAQNNESFRTPAKLYAGAYSVKILLKKDFTEYDVPVWIKPDQAESTFDASLLKDLGYVDKQIVFDEVKISNEILEKKKFKNLKSEWAFVPDYAKSCCYGVLGRDVLSDFEIRFDPKDPTHLEWTRIISEGSSIKYKPLFLTELKKLFSLSRISDVPYLLNLKEQKLEFAASPIKTQEPTLFSFSFVPPDRRIKVQTILARDAISAKSADFKSGLLISKINNKKVSELDRWQIEKYLRGGMDSSIKLITDQDKEFIFDFKMRQFTKVPVLD